MKLTKPRRALTSAGKFVIGTKYVIANIGTTDFTLIGATSNTVGLSFTATGSGSGTGSAFMAVRKNATIL